MSVSIAKFAPTAIVFAAVGYCCWPYLDEQRPVATSQESPKMPEIAAGQLTPKIVPKTDRDPFGVTSAPKNVNDVKTDTEKGKAGKTATENAKAASSAPGKSKGGELTTSGLFNLAKYDMAKPVKIDTSVLTLNATFLRGARHVAVINGKLYSEGDALAKVDSQTKAPVVARIFPRKVLLEQQGQQAELYYSHVKKKPEAPSFVPQVMLPAALTSFFNPKPAASPKGRAANEMFQPLELLQNLLPKPTRAR